MVRRSAETLEFSETKLAHGWVTFDVDGNVWVAHDALRDEDRIGSWKVFAADRRIFGFVDVATGGRILEFDDDYMLGRWRMAMHIEHVKIHRLNNRKTLRRVTSTSR